MFDNIVPANFRFQNMWLVHESFLSNVETNWKAQIFPYDNCTSMIRFWLKLKRLKQNLKWWNKCVFKNLFTNILEAEKQVESAETVHFNSPTENNRLFLNKVRDNLVNLQVQEEIYWKQKAASKFLTEGDRNTKFFHNIVNHKRATSHIHKITTPEGQLLNNPELIYKSGVNYFKEVFNKHFTPSLDLDLSFIPTLVKDDDNIMLLLPLLLLRSKQF